MYSNRSNVDNRINWLKFLRKNDLWSYSEMTGWSYHKWGRSSKRQCNDIIKDKNYDLARKLKRRK